MQEAEVVLSVLRERGEKGLPCTQLYRQMFNRDLYLERYSKGFSVIPAVPEGRVTLSTVSTDLGGLFKTLDMATARGISFALRSVNERMRTVGSRCSHRPVVWATASAVHAMRGAGRGSGQAGRPACGDWYLPVGHAGGLPPA